MDNRISVSIEENKLTLSGVLDYESVLAVDVQGQEWISTSVAHECCIDLNLVTYSNSAGIALLLGWSRIAIQQKKSLRVQKLPANMAALAKVCGLDEFFV